MAGAVLGFSLFQDAAVSSDSCLGVQPQRQPGSQQDPSVEMLHSGQHCSAGGLDRFSSWPEKAVVEALLDYT